MAIVKMGVRQQHASVEAAGLGGEERWSSILLTVFEREALTRHDECRS